MTTNKLTTKKEANNVAPPIVFIGKHNENKLKKINVKCLFI